MFSYHFRQNADSSSPSSSSCPLVRTAGGAYCGSCRLSTSASWAGSLLRDLHLSNFSLFWFWPQKNPRVMNSDDDQEGDELSSSFLAADDYLENKPIVTDDHHEEPAAAADDDLLHVATHDDDATTQIRTTQFQYHDDPIDHYYGGGGGRHHHHHTKTTSLIRASEQERPEDRDSSAEAPPHLQQGSTLALERNNEYERRSDIDAVVAPAEVVTTSTGTSAAAIVSSQEQSSLDDEDEEERKEHHEPAITPPVGITTAALMESHHDHDFVDDGLGGSGVEVYDVHNDYDDDSPPFSQQQQQRRCVVCGTDNGKPLLHFHPVEHDLLVSAAAPAVTSFTMAISLHVFCGRTASILPHINRPDLEILTKAGLKNKHGIGQDVDGALSRTRCATVPTAETTTSGHAKEKQFYLVREFEANLAAVRNSFVVHQPPAEMTPLVLTNCYLPIYHSVGSTAAPPPPGPQHHHHHHNSVFRHGNVAADDGAMPLQHRQLVAGDLVPSPPRTKRSRSAGSSSSRWPKIRCECGGRYTNPSSMRNHVKTKRHVKWEENRGAL